ncbi:hypothetical protein ID007_004327 [Salmonella enterica]|nr:hypothetical protein [Salmonella enterica]
MQGSNVLDTLRGWIFASAKHEEPNEMRKHIIFTSLSRRKRRAKVQGWKNQIRRESARCSPLFWDMADIDAAMSVGWQWSDIVFLGSEPDVYWNATIETCGCALSESQADIAFSEAWNMLTREEKAAETNFETEPQHNAQGKVISHRMIRPEKPAYEKFGGLTFHDYINKRQAEIASGSKPAVYASYRIIPGYGGGIGLSMIVDAEYLTREIVENAIRDFLARGENNWISDTPAVHDVPRAGGSLPLYGLD